MSNNGFTAEFISQMTNLKNSYLLSFATVDLLNHDDVLSILEKDSFTTGTFDFKFSDICTLVRKSKQNNNRDFEILIWEFLMFSTRALLVNLYESLKEDSLRYSLVKDTDWFVFLSNLRHSLAHGINANWKINSFGKTEIFYKRMYDKTKIVIQKEWDNQPMRFEQIGGWITTIDLIQFISSESEKFLFRTDK